jgi:hypothetical protein
MALLDLQPDVADLERLGQEWNHIQAQQTTEDGTRHARSPPVDFEVPPPPSFKVVAPPSSATLQRQDSGSSSSSSSGSGGGLSSERPRASSGHAPTYDRRAKKRAFTSPYHEFCKERRPFLPAGLTNSEREKLLGAAWKAHLAETKMNSAETKRPRQTFRAAPVPLPGGSRVAWDHATHAPAPPQPQLSAPRPAPQPQLVVRGQEDPAAPHWIKLVVTDGMLRGGQITLQITLERSGGRALCFAVPPDARAGQCIIVNLPPGVVRGQILRVHCQPPPAPYQPPPGPLLGPLLPPFPRTSLQALSRPAVLRPTVLRPTVLRCAFAVPPTPRRCAPEPHLAPPLELLSAAATHRTGVESYLDHDQQHLAEVMDNQMTEEEAIEIAISLGMPHPSTARSPSVGRLEEYGAPMLALHGELR